MMNSTTMGIAAAIADRPSDPLTGAYTCVHCTWKTSLHAHPQAPHGAPGYRAPVAPSVLTPKQSRVLRNILNDVRAPVAVCVAGTARIHAAAPTRPLRFVCPDGHQLPTPHHL